MISKEKNRSQREFIVCVSDEIEIPIFEDPQGFVFGKLVLIGWIVGLPCSGFFGYDWSLHGLETGPVDTLEKRMRSNLIVAKTILSWT